MGWGDNKTMKTCMSIFRTRFALVLGLSIVRLARLKIMTIIGAIQFRNNTVEPLLNCNADYV